jgi:hypothetical protein
MENTSSNVISQRDIFYFRQRQRNRVFSKLAAFFANEAHHNGLTKKHIASVLKRDPSQITRWLSEPNNLTLDTISDILLALGSEMDYTIVKFNDRPKSNIIHPLIADVMRSERHDPSKKERELHIVTENMNSSRVREGAVEIIELKTIVDAPKTTSNSTPIKFAKTFELELA